MSTFAKKSASLEQTRSFIGPHKLANYLYVVYILTIITLLILPPSDGIKLNKTIFGIRTDLVIHATMFVPFMGYFWFQNWVKSSLKRFLKFFGYGVLFAAFCESIHLVVPYRSFDVTDFFANVTGLAIGSLIFLIKRKSY